MSTERFYIILDLEATCEENNKNFTNEIIEIGAVKISSKGEIVDTFNRFVKPVVNPILTPFCINLTGISQEQIDTSDKFPIVFDEFKKWCEDGVLASWGFYDKNQLIKDCNLHKIISSWLENKRHISLKHQHQKIKGIRRAVGVLNALKMEGLSFEGSHHRGIDDAKNIARIFIIYKDKWDWR